MMCGISEREIYWTGHNSTNLCSQVRALPSLRTYYPALLLRAIPMFWPARLGNDRGCFQYWIYGLFSHCECRLVRNRPPAWLTIVVNFWASCWPIWELQSRFRYIGENTFFVYRLFNVSANTSKVDFLQIIAWSLIQAGWIHYLLSTFNAHDWTIRHVTLFKVDTLFLLNGVIYFRKAVQRAAAK